VDVLFFAFTAAANPSLLGATTLMLLAPKPKRLLVGYLCGGLITSVTLGLVIVSSLEGSSERRRERRERKGKPERKQGPSRLQRLMARGSARSAFIAGVVLNFPGASYLAALDGIAKNDWSTAGNVAAILLVNVIMLILLELPLLGYILAPETTPQRVAAFRAWLSSHGRRIGIRVATAIGLLLWVRAVIELVV